jgi:hypothetical protein
MKLEPLASLFSRFLFRTPDYQRGYAWEEQHVRDFWDDLSRIGLANPQHFAGTLILETTPGQVPTVATVVDGQQRLTTAVLLLAAIAELWEKRGCCESADDLRGQFLGTSIDPKFRYGKTHDSWPYLALNVFKDMSYVAKAAEHDSAYTINLDNARTALRTWLADLPDDKVEELVEKLSGKLLFSVVEVDPMDFNIHVAFESINHRGKQLTQLELLKNRLIYIATVLASPDQADKDESDRQRSRLRDDVNAAWSDVYSWLGREGKTPLDEEEFLRTHSMIYFRVDTGEQGWLEKLLFRDRFAVSRALEGDLNFAELTIYLNSLRLSALLWSHIQRPRNMPKDQVTWLERISHVHKPLFDPVILAAYVRLLEDNQTWAADLRRTEGLDKHLVNVLQQIERFNVLVFLVSGRRSHTSRKEFVTIAHQLHNGLGPFGRPMSSALDYLARYVKACVFNYADGDGDDEAFQDPEFAWKGWLDLEAFEKQIKKLLRDEGGYYDHEWTKVLLFEYEDELRTTHRGDANVKWQSVGSETIEHIYPQNDSHWLELTRSLGHGNKKAKINSYRHSLGNLLLLSRAKNSRLLNNPYAGKDPEKAKRPRFAQGSFSETAVAAKYNKWTAKAIETRGKELLQFAERRWNFSFRDRGIKDLKRLLVLP